MQTTSSFSVRVHRRQTNSTNQAILAMPEVIYEQVPIWHSACMLLLPTSTYPKKKWIGRSGQMRSAQVSHICMVKSSIPGQVKPVTYEIDSCRSPSLGITRIGQVTWYCDWVGNWDMVPAVWSPSEAALLSHHDEFALSQAGTRPDITLDGARM